MTITYPDLSFSEMLTQVSRCELAPDGRFRFYVPRGYGLLRPLDFTDAAVAAYDPRLLDVLHHVFKTMRALVYAKEHLQSTLQHWVQPGLYLPGDPQDTYVEKILEVHPTDDVQRPLWARCYTLGFTHNAVPFVRKILVEGIHVDAQWLDQHLPGVRTAMEMAETLGYSPTEVANFVFNKPVSSVSMVAPPTLPDLTND